MSGCQATEIQPSLPLAPGEVWKLSVGDLATGDVAYWRVETWREQVQNALIERCVHSDGAEGYTPTPIVPDAMAAALGDPNYASRSGYGIAAAMQATQNSHENADLDRILLGSDTGMLQVTMPGSYTMMVPRSGCFARAREELGSGDIISWARVEYLPEQLQSWVVSTTPETAAMREAQAKWRSCVAVAGYRVEKPSDLRQALQASAPSIPSAFPTSDSFASAEVAAAETDLRCQDVSNLRTASATAYAIRAGQLDQDQHTQGVAVIQSIRNAALWVAKNQGK
jgi:hypothetical protein